MNFRNIFSRKYLAIWILVGLSAPGAIFFILFHSQILEKLEVFGNYLRGLGFSGSFLVMFLIFLTGFPPIFGYSSLLTLCGYVYKLPAGFFPAYLGALAGAVGCFLLSRRYFKQRARRFILDQYPIMVRAIEGAVEKGGLKLITMIRLAPYPFGVVSLMLSTTQIPFKLYFTASAIALTKNIFHVIVGSFLESLTSTRQTTAGEIAFMVLAGIFGVGVFAYITISVRRSLQEFGGELTEDDELPFSNQELNTYSEYDDVDDDLFFKQSSSPSTSYSLPKSANYDLGNSVGINGTTSNSLPVRRVSISSDGSPNLFEVKIPNVVESEPLFIAETSSSPSKKAQSELFLDNSNNKNTHQNLRGWDNYDFEEDEEFNFK